MCTTCHSYVYTNICQLSIHYHVMCSLCYILHNSRRVKVYYTNTIQSAFSQRLPQPMALRQEKTTGSKYPLMSKGDAKTAAGRSGKQNPLCAGLAPLSVVWTNAYRTGISCALLSEQW